MEAPFEYLGTKGCLHERGSPFAQLRAQCPVKQTAAKHTHSKEAVGKNPSSPTRAAASPRPGRGEGPGGPASGRRSRWHGLGPERQLSAPPARERGFLPPERGWGLSRGQEGPSCQVSATSGCGESPAHHIPLANADKRRTSFQRRSVLHKRVPLWARTPWLWSWFRAPARVSCQGTRAHLPPSWCWEASPGSCPRAPRRKFALAPSRGGTELAGGPCHPSSGHPGRCGPRRCLSLPSPDI